MKCIKKIALIFINIYCFYSFSLSQETTVESYRMVNWNFEQGFPHKYTMSFLKDHRGFLWVGTQTGLSRFDGNNFVNYFPDPEGKKNIPGIYISGIVEDSLHNIWIGSDRGLWRYDIEADSFSHFSNSLNVDSTNNNSIPFWATRNEIICMEADSVFTTFNIHTLHRKKLASLAHRVNDNRTIALSIFDEPENAIWLLPAGASLFAPPGLFRLSISDGKLSYYSLPPNKYFDINRHWIEGICFDNKRKSIWINLKGGLFRFSLVNREFHFVDASKNLVDGGAGISMDNRDRLWVGTGGVKGMYIYDPADDSVSIPFRDDIKLRDSLNFANYRIYCDIDGITWVGYWTQQGKGITQVTPFNPPALRYSRQIGIPNAYNLKNWYNIKADKGTVRIFGRGAVNIVNSHSGRIYAIDKHDLKGIDTTLNIIFLGIDSAAEKVWLCSENPEQLYVMDVATFRCRPVSVKFLPGHDYDAVGINEFSIRPFRDGYIFLGGKGGLGELGVYSIQKDSPFVNQILAIENQHVKDLATDGIQTIFLKTKSENYNQSYSLAGGEWKKGSSPFDSIPWVGIYYNERDQTWWTGAYMQLDHFDSHFRLIHRYTQKEGIRDIQVYGIISDNQGNIWFNGSSGYISMLNMKSGTIVNLSEKDGFTRSTYYPMYFVVKDVQGDIYFSGYDGLDRITPSKYISGPSTIYLKSISVKAWKPPVSTGVDKITELELEYFQNSINIETGAVDYYSEGKSRIRYRLGNEKRIEAWQYAPANTTIRYNELSVGKYTLDMQAGNASGDFTGPVKTLFIRINPAFWNTWWFRIPVFLVLIGLIFGIMRWRIRQRFSIQLAKSEKETEIAGMRQRTAELQKQASELEMQALRAQMNPHFIFNSLNSINRFILQNDRLQASEYLTKFSRLVRMILQNSQSSLISLESELESLSLYLELEALRFEHRFEFRISVPRELDISDLQVPPLIIQPYAENAIWHGLMHKEEKGQLDIEVSEEKDHLYVKVADNGIGRKRSAELASKSATKHKSMGLKITANRIAMLESSNGQEDPITIHDLEHEDGTAAGTEVIIKMPLIYA